MKILMVCLGNICRSPMAEGVMKHKLSIHRKNGHVESAGTGDWHAGEPPDTRAVQTALRHGIDISDQRARQIILDDFLNFDRIFVMDRSVYDDVLRLARHSGHEHKVDFLMNASEPGNNRPVPDPYFGGVDGFEFVFSLIDEACEHIALSLH